MKRFHAHIAAVGDKVGDRLVGIVKRHFHIRLYPGHPLCGRCRLLALVAMLKKLRLDIGKQDFVLVTAIGKAIAHLLFLYVGQNVVYRGYAHFNTRVAFAQ